MPGMPFWIWMNHQETMVLNPMSLVPGVADAPTGSQSHASTEQFYGRIHAEIDRRLRENLPRYVQENDWLAKALRQNQLLTVTANDRAQ